MVIITFKTILNEKVLSFCKVTVPKPDWVRRGHGLPRNKLAQIFAGAFYQFSVVRKQTEVTVGLKTTSLTDYVTDYSSQTKLLTVLHCYSQVSLLYTLTAGIDINHSTMFTLLQELSVVCGCGQKWLQFKLQNSLSRAVAIDARIYTTIQQICKI